MSFLNCQIVTIFKEHNNITTVVIPKFRNVSSKMISKMQRSWLHNKMGKIKIYICVVVSAFGTTKYVYETSSDYCLMIIQ